MWTRWMIRWRGLAPIVADAVLATVVAAVSFGGLVRADVQPRPPISWYAVALVLLGTLPLAARRLRPLAVLAVVEVAALLYLIIAPERSPEASLGIAVALYTVARVADRRISLRIVGFVAAVNVLILLVDVVLGRPESVAGLVAMAAAIVGAWSLGDNVRTRRAYLAQLEERAHRLEMEREENTRRAVEEERARIARELHDVVAHHVSAIAVQAGAAEEIAERDPQRARASLRFIQETSRQALAEMRALLNVLRGADELGAERDPQPSLSHVERLVAQSRGAGMAVTLRVEGAVRPLPEALDVSAYRIVQEALTNSLKHAAPAHTEVLVRYAAEALELNISDDGRGPATRPEGAREGRGLIGMRERVALFGGDLVAGAAVDGSGFTVQARLPLRAQ